jgi:CheY-like chemotaxis protein
MEANSESNTTARMEAARHADFLARLDHELRTPLHAITGSAELLEMKLGDDDHVKLILKAARELLDIINRELTAPGGDDANAALPATSQCNVLYIEDDPINFAVVAHTLQLRPTVKVSQATNGETGLALAQAQSPKLILLDLNLPDMHGSEVLRRLQQNVITAQIPVVVLSADATGSQIERLLSAGARNYLTKPFELKLFLAVIDEIFEETLSAN